MLDHHIAMCSTSILLVGIGQSLRSDDALGLIAVRQWQAAHPEMSGMVEVALAENPGLGLLDLVLGYQTVILVDAVQSGAPAGTLHRVHAEQAAAFTPGSQSAHGWGIAETLWMGKKLYPSSMPSQLVLLGIELDSLHLGEGLSEKVSSGLPRLVDAIQAEIEQSLKGMATPEG